MKYGTLPGLDKPVSRLVFGTAIPPLFAAAAPGAGRAEKRTAYALLDRVYAAGVNTFDCAAHYGEEVMGAWMEDRGLRDQCVIITKCAHPNRWRDRVTDYDILSDAHDSLAKLRTDKIDLYMLHRDNKTVPVGIITEVMNRLYREGKIAVYGGSNWTHERIAEANVYAEEHGLEPMRISSPNFGLAEQVADPWRGDAKFGDGCVTISGPENAEARAWYRTSGVSVFAYSSLARGFFSGAFRSSEAEKAKEHMDAPGITGYFCERNVERLRRCEILAEEKGVTVAQLAMAWIFSQPFPVYAVCSPGSEKHLNDNIAAMSIPLTPDEAAWLNLEQ